jgi:hypothetical protein
MISSKFSKGAIFCALIVSSLAAHAQDSFDARVADFMLLQPKQIQTAVGITSAQRDKLNAFAKESDQKIEAFFKGQQQKGIDIRTITPSNPVIAGYYAELKAKVFQILTPPQIRRLRELTLQRTSVAGLTNPIVAKRVGLSPTQSAAIKKLVSSFQASASATAQQTANAVLSQYRGIKPKDQADASRLRQEIDGKMHAAEVMLEPRIKAAQKSLDANVMAQLTPTQKATWKGLLGKPFGPG